MSNEPCEVCNDTGWCVHRKANFRFGDSRATEYSDSLGGCCGKPIGCWIDSRGCVNKKDKTDWQNAVLAGVEDDEEE